jgi:hypothetical protein
MFLNGDTISMFLNETFCVVALASYSFGDGRKTLIFTGAHAMPLPFRVVIAILN